MKRNASTALSTGITILFASLVLGCGGGSSDGPPPPVCPIASESVGGVCTSNTDTSTSTLTGTGTDTSTLTGTNTGTGTSTGTGTATNTAVVPDPEACDYRNPDSVTGGKAVVGSGLYTFVAEGVSWNICITGVATSDISVEGYGFKTSELGQANPPSLVRYEGVIGEKCVQLHPVTWTSSAPDLVAAGVTVTSGGVTVNDSRYTATWTRDRAAGCPYPTPKKN